MLGYALRRVLWSLPALVGISLITFFFLSYVPDLTDDPVVRAALPPSEIARLRRERFLDLPRFLNLAPRDIRKHASALVEAVAAQGPDALGASAELARLGGAALPYVLPQLDALAPEPRTAVALALAPIARRMGMATAEVDDPAHAAGFWARFWDDRSVEFRRMSVRSAVSRLVRYGSAARSADLLELDTFVLDDVLSVLTLPVDPASQRRARALIEVAAHVSERDDRIGPSDDLETARACVDRWLLYWAAYRSDFVADTGLARAADMVIETRYGKWVYEAVTHRWGRGMAGVPVLDELLVRAPVTLALVSGAIALAYTLAITLGAVSAAYRGRRIDVLLLLAVLLLYATPTAVLAVLAARVGGGRLLVAIAVLAPAIVPMPLAQQRAALLLALAQEPVRAATARGAGPVRALLVHALRNACFPVATLAVQEGPMALGGAFVVERVLSIRGMGELTLAAVSRRDVAWLMAISMCAALMAALAVVIGDIAYVVLDPRLRGTVFGLQERS